MALLLRARELEHTRVMRAGIEADELLVSGPAKPVIDAAVLLAEVGRALEQHHGADLAALHLDGVLVRPAALALKRRVPDAVLAHDVAVEALALLLCQGNRLG